MGVYNLQESDSAGSVTRSWMLILWGENLVMQPVWAQDFDVQIFSTCMKMMPSERTEDETLDLA